MSERWKQVVWDLSRKLPSPQIGVLVLPCQAPGPRSLEHDIRIARGLDIWRGCCLYVSSPILITTADCRDRHSRTSALYMRDQYLSMSVPKGDWKMEDYIRIGEERSFHTAASFRYLREHFQTFHYDLVVLVSHSLHLWAAGPYWKHLLSDVPMVKASSGSGWGSIGKAKIRMSYPRRLLFLLHRLLFLLRESVHYGAAMSLDWLLEGTLLDRLGYSKRVAAKWRKLEWPPIPT